MKNLMIDIETMAGTDDAAVIAIGAQWFDAGGLGEGHEWRCTFEAAREAGRRFDPGTVEWWMQQDKKAQEQLLSEPRMNVYSEMLEALGVVARRAKFVWAKGPGFDLRILRSSYKAMELPCPWHYRSELCVRTMLAMASACGMTDVFDGGSEIKHGALSDAQWQAKQVSLIMRNLK